MAAEIDPGHCALHDLVNFNVILSQVVGFAQQTSDAVEGPLVLAKACPGILCEGSTAASLYAAFASFSHSST